MKLHFEPNLDYQLEAIEAVCDLFRGQEQGTSELSVRTQSKSSQFTLGIADADLGVGNQLLLSSEALLANLQGIQLRHHLPQSAALESRDFTVEMETGTGKTYVYLRTVFELNARFGFTKFVVVVPSVAIKEGVFKSLQITQEHFKNLYAGVPVDFFIYDSSKLGQVRNFATSAQIQIMVVTVQSLVRKDHAVVYKDSEKTGGERPIDLIRATHPVLMIDEPQSVDGGKDGKGRLALQEMNPLCTLRYSATHADRHHMLYRLNAVDAYERKLVKQIEVAAATVEDAHNKPFVRLVSVKSLRGKVSAKLELDAATTTGVARREVLVCDGDELVDKTKRAIYTDFRVGEINCTAGAEFLELRYPGGEVFLQLGQAHADVETLAVQREMIRRTIKEHLDKELRLRPMGIKVLSLFFIDAVGRYRQVDADGQSSKGVYALIFEEEYRRAARLPLYHPLFVGVDVVHEAQAVHNGYFSIDKKGGWSDTSEGNAGSRENAERAYNLIMKDKEKLLDLATPLKFIFSHSALKEGWDNPNVFQICALREMGSERERRQSIGRGLRICVNQSGERVRGFEVNTLTVIARESFEDFAQSLQREFEEETGLKFGVVEAWQLCVLTHPDASGKPVALGTAAAELLMAHLLENKLINAQGKVQDALRMALKNDTLALPEAFEPERGDITALLKRMAGRLELKNAADRVPVKARLANLHSEEFKALWDRIKHQTTYRVAFDHEALVAQAIADLKEAPETFKPRLQWHKADLTISQSGVQASEKVGAYTVALEESAIELPDVLTDLQERTQLTRRSIARILGACGRLDDFKRNPQQFIELAANIINRCKQLALVDGIKYQKLGDKQFYAQSLFEEKELSGYLLNLLPSKKSVYEQVVFDSGTEEKFAAALELNDAVKVYAKLPGWFKVPTPLGTYNPDWAVLVERDEEQRLYFVVETKSSLFKNDRRSKENAQMTCGKAHFAALRAGDNPACYTVASSAEDFLARTLGK